MLRARKFFTGGKIRGVRGEPGLTQAGLAQKLGNAASYLNQIENSQRHASASVLPALDEDFSVDTATHSDQIPAGCLPVSPKLQLDPVSGGVQPPLSDAKLSADAPASSSKASWRTITSPAR